MVSSVFVVPLVSAASSKSAARPMAPARQATRLPKGKHAELLLLDEFVGDRESGLIRVVVESFLAEPRYNPLVIVGPAAVGKSVLTTGLADRWNQRSPDHPALLLRGEDFARNYADALETDSLGKFRRRFLQAGAVVLDGLESLAEKNSAQLEFARVLDSLCDQKIPTLITCRGEPELPRFHPALWSRLHGGLLAPLLPPGSEARRKILLDLLGRNRLRLQPDALEVLVQGLARDHAARPTVPQLATAINQLAAHVGEAPQPWSVDVVQDFLAEQSSASTITTSDIVRVVAEYFGLRVSDVRGSSRRRQVVRARGLATYLARQVTNQSLESLGQYFGGRDHTTAMHACRSMEELLKTDPLLQQAAAALTQRLTTQHSNPKDP